MEPEFIIKTVMAVVGVGLIATGIVLTIRGKKTSSKVWGAVAIAAGVVIWIIILFTTIVSSTIS
jgi:hypothetical protein